MVVFFFLFQSLTPGHMQGTFEMANKEENREKNRYPNILPCKTLPFVETSQLTARAALSVLVTLLGWSCSSDVISLITNGLSIFVWSKPVSLAMVSL